jgi:hypothetical protein
MFLHAAGTHNSDIKVYSIVVRSRGAGGKAKAVAGPGDNGAAEQQPLPPQQKQLQPQRRVKTLLPKIRRTSTSQSEDDSGGKHAEPSSPPPPYVTPVVSVPVTKPQTEVLEGEGWYENFLNRSIFLFVHRLIIISRA